MDVPTFPPLFFPLLFLAAAYFLAKYNPRKRSLTGPSAPPPLPLPLPLRTRNPADVMVYGERPLAVTDIPETLPHRCLCGGNDVTAIAALGGDVYVGDDHNARGYRAGNSPLTRAEPTGRNSCSCTPAPIFRLRGGFRPPSMPLGEARVCVHPAYC